MSLIHGSSSNKSSSKKLRNHKVGNLYHILDLIDNDDINVNKGEEFIPIPRKQLPHFVNIVNSSLQLTDKEAVVQECIQESKKHWRSSNGFVTYSNKIKTLDITDEPTIDIYADRKFAYEQYLIDKEENREKIINKAKFDADRSLYELTRKNRQDPIAEQKKIYRDIYHSVGNSSLRAGATYNSNYVGSYKRSVSSAFDDGNNDDDDDESVSITDNEIKRFGDESRTQVVSTPRSAMLKEIVQKRITPFIIKDLFPPLVHKVPKRKLPVPTVTTEEIEYFNTVFSFLSINPTKETVININYNKVNPKKADIKLKQIRPNNDDDYIGKVVDSSTKIFKDPTIIRRRGSEFKDMKMTRILQKFNENTFEPAETLPYSDNKVTKIDLRNQGLGDEKALCLAAALCYCPNITTIDISGNRLTEVSLNPLLMTINDYMKCSVINLSECKVDDVSISLLKDNLQDPECRLKELYLSKSFIDDKKCAELILSISQNHTLRTLDLSNNLIGEMEDHKNTFADFITGAEAVSQVILINSTLLELNLSWNNIRKDSAMSLAVSLGESKSLQIINLSNNNLCDVACQHLFFNLRHNTSLKNLDVSYNSIYPKGIAVLASVLGYNKTLVDINVNGNNIGSEGGKNLLRAVREAAREKRTLLIHFRNCNVHYSDKKLFSRDKPGRLYELNLSNPYEWAIANTLHEIAMNKSTAFFTSLSYKSPGSKSKWETIKLQRMSEASNISTLQKDINHINECIDAILKAGKSTSLMKKKAREAIKLIGGRMGLLLVDVVADRIRQSLLKVQKQLRDKIYMMFRIIFRTVFKIVDKDNSGSIDEQELSRCLILLGIKGLDDEGVNKHQLAIEHARRMIGGVDVDRSGTLDQGEFERMLFVNYTETSPINPPPLVDPKTSSPYIIPDNGFLKIEFYYDSLPPTARELQTDDTVRVLTKSMKKVLKTEEEKAQAWEFSINSDMFLTSEQAEEMIKHFKSHDERWLQTIINILPNLVTTFEACKFLAQHLSFKEIMMLRIRWGNYFRAITGIATGHYSLDFTMPYDRLAGMKLGELNNLDKNKIQSESETRDTSQSGNWENFRNESFNEKHRQLNGKFFQDDPQMGKARFDFVVTTRPVQGIIPVSDDAVEKMMQIVFKAEDLFPSNINTTAENYFPTDSEDGSVVTKPNESNVTKDADVVESSSRRKAFFQVAAMREDAETIAREKAERQMIKEREIAARILKKKLTSQWLELISSNYENYLCSYDAFLKKKIAESKEELAQSQGNSSIEPVEETPSFLRQLYNTKSFKEGRKTAYYQVALKVDKVKNIGSLDDDILESNEGTISLEEARSPKMKKPTKMEKQMLSEREATIMIQKCISFENNLLTLEVYMIYNMWISCTQLIDIYEAFQERDAPVDVLVRVVCIVFSRIVDLENFGLLLTRVPREIKCEIIHRIGILNVWCLMIPDGIYELDLASKDHREALKLLIKLAEPGQNALIEKYFTTRVEEPKRDLEIPPSWRDPDDSKVGNIESGPPRYGHLIFKYTSDPALVDNEARREMTILRTLAGTRGTFIKGFDVSLSDIDKEQVRVRSIGSVIGSSSISYVDDEDLDLEVTSFDTF